jgi:fatty-acyl-CoA synthase
MCPAIHSKLPDAKLPLLTTAVVIGTNVPAGAISYEAFVARGASHSQGESAEVRPDDVLLMQFTSGTTSYPKGVMLTHDNMLRNAAHVVQRFNCSKAIDISAHAPFIMWRVRRFRCSPRLLAARASIHRPHSMPAKPACHVSREMHADFWQRHNVSDAAQSSGFRVESAYPARRMGIMRRGGHAENNRSHGHAWRMSGLWTIRSSTECLHVVLHRRYRKAHQWLGAYSRRPGSSIVDPESGATLPPGEAGEIYVRGWSVMKGYYKMPEQTAKAIDADKWLHSGDSA